MPEVCGDIFVNSLIFLNNKYDRHTGQRGISSVNTTHRQSNIQEQKHAYTPSLSLINCIIHSRVVSTDILLE